MSAFTIGKYKTYSWKGLNKWQQKVKGILVAENDESAERETQRLGVTVTELKTRSYLMLPSKNTKKIKVVDIVYMMRQLSTLIKAGVPLIQSLEIISSGTEKIRLCAMLLCMRDSIAAGETFAEALGDYPKIFNTLICGLISSGEQSGTLDRIVNEISSYLEHREYLKNRIKRVLYYPITVLSVAVLVCLAMLIFLVPRFETIYKSFGAKLPAFTQSMVNMSHVIRNDWYLILMVLALIVYMFKKFKQKSLRLQHGLDLLAIKMILFGKLIQKAIISRICMTLSITLSAGIPLIDALDRVASVANNRIYSDAILGAKEEVMQGTSISLAMRSTQRFPAMVTQMIEIGEKSGELDHMLDKIAEYYRDEVNTSVDGLTTLIEPLLIVVLGVLIGIFVIAMYLPIFNLGLAIK